MTRHPKSKVEKFDLEQFICLQCHACYRQPGYVRLKKAEPDVIAKFLQMDVRRFIDTFTLLTDDRTGLSLMEQDGGACVFLTEHGCRIQPVKPEQCRDFPRKWRFSGFKQICGWARAQHEYPDAEQLRSYHGQGSLKDWLCPKMHPSVSKNSSEGIFNCLNDS